MTHPEAPRLETRSSQEIADCIAARLDLLRDGSDAMSDGLLAVFGRYFEIVAERLNRVPEKQHLAFLDLFGARLGAPVPARVPLTFLPVKQLVLRDQAAAERSGSQAPAFVPAFTQAAAALADGKDEPVVFETERALELTSVQLKKVVARDPPSDAVADYGDLVAGGSPGVSLFADRARPARHELYIRRPDELPADLSTLVFHFDIQPGLVKGKANQVVEWSLADEAAAVLVSGLDTTAGLTRSGEVRFTALSKRPTSKVNGVEGRWLRCRLVSGLPCRPEERSDEASMSLPVIQAIDAAGAIELTNQLPEKAFYNGQPLDVTAGFFPFGQRPMFSDVFYLGSSMFTYGDAQVAVAVQLANPLVETAAPPPGASLPVEKPRLIWEAPSGDRWIPLYCEDGTNNFTQSGTVKFRLPQSVGPTAVNGIEGGWIRARFTGHAPPGREALEKLLVAAAKQPARPVDLATYAPAIEGIAVSVSKTFARCPVAGVVKADDFGVETASFPVSLANEPFTLLDCGHKALYVGLEAQRQAIEGRTVALYFFARDPARNSVSTVNLLRKRVHCRAEFWCGDRWAAVRTSDETNGLGASGNVILSFDPDACSSGNAGPGRLYWIRLLWPSDQTFPSQVERVALNTVMAINATTSENELLGSSKNTPNQAFRCAHAPVLPDIRLEVREDLRFPSKQLALAPALRGEKARTSGNVPEPGEGEWVSWTVVKDLVRSGPNDRHFVLEPISGKVSFGDGVNGRIPPGGANNVRIRRYRYGGGARGNVAANTVTELRTTVPLVSGVTNFVAAQGGLDAERTDRGSAREVARLRHRDRAVAREDYEDLALGIPGIARAKCFPTRDLTRDENRELGAPGSVSVVIVPDSRETTPTPTRAQLFAVHEFLSKRTAPEIALTVVGPEYVGIHVDAQLVCKSDRYASDVEVRCRTILSDYLHPLTGGPNGAGWPFGRRPGKTALMTLLQHVEGVAQVRHVSLRMTESRPVLSDSDHYLVSSGEHRITCTADADASAEV